MRNQKKKVNKIILIIRVLSVVVIIISIYYIYNWHLDNENSNEVVEEIFNEVEISNEEVIVDNSTQTDIVKIEYEELLNINSDTIGWIKVPGTNINYPVVQAKDNSFYLNHSFDKSYNKSGWIFADYMNKNLKSDKLDKNTVIYGHNRENDSMFGTLSNALTNQWRKNLENQYINFSTINKDMVWRVFSTYTIESEDYYIQTKFSSNREYDTFLKILKNRSIYDFGVSLSSEDNILTLSTCTNIGEGRTVVHAKLVEIKK